MLFYLSYCTLPHFVRLHFPPRHSVYFMSLQVRKVNLSKEESLMIMGYGGAAPELLANETLMRQGQVIRSTTNQVYIHYRSLRQTNHGMFSLHYQGKSDATKSFCFSNCCHYCMTTVKLPFSHRGHPQPFCCPARSLCLLRAAASQWRTSTREVRLTSTVIQVSRCAAMRWLCVSTRHSHAGALLGLSVSVGKPPRSILSRFVWMLDSNVCFVRFPSAVSCGGWIRNATVGRILSPPPPSVSNHSNGNNLSCHWLIEAKEGHRLHLHFERIALDEDDDK